MLPLQNCEEKILAPLFYHNYDLDDFFQNYSKTLESYAKKAEQVFESFTLK